jgi:hypothetical protein
MSCTSHAQASLDVGQLSFYVGLRSRRWRRIVISEHQRPLLPDEGEPELQYGIQNKVIRAMLERVAHEDFI